MKMETYNDYVEQEENYYKKLDTLEQCQCALFDHIYRYGELLDWRMAEEVMLSIHKLEVKVRLELLGVKMAKVELAYKLK